MRGKVVHRHLRHGASSAMPRLRSFFLRLLQCLPFFRSHRRFLLGFFIRFALFGHTGRSLSVNLKPIIQRNDEWPSKAAACTATWRMAASGKQTSERIDCGYPDDQYSDIGRHTLGNVRFTRLYAAVDNWSRCKSFARRTVTINEAAPTTTMSAIVPPESSA